MRFIILYRLVESSVVTFTLDSMPFRKTTLHVERTHNDQASSHVGERQASILDWLKTYQGRQTGLTSVKYEPSPTLPTASHPLTTTRAHTQLPQAV